MPREDATGNRGTQSIAATRILRADDPLYRQGMELLWEDGRIETNLIDTPEDFYLWMKAWEHERRSPADGNSDFVYVATSRTYGAVGFLYSEFYADAKWLFVSYLVTRSEFATAMHGRVATILMDALDMTMRQCGARGIIYELGYGDYYRGRDRVFRFGIAARGMRLYKMRFLQPALSLIEDGYSVQEECLCVATTACEEPSAKTVAEFMYDQIYNLQDQGSEAYAAHLAEIRGRMMRSLEANAWRWTDASTHADKTSPSLGLAAERTVVVESMLGGCINKATAISRADLEDLRQRVADFDLFVDEVAQRLTVRGRPSHIQEMGGPQRAFLWMTLCRCGDRIEHDELLKLVSVSGGSSTAYAYKSRLGAILGKRLTSRIFRALRGYRAWQVEREGWSFCWVRRSMDPGMSDLVQGLVRQR